MRIFKVRAAKTKYNYYTINSDIEGAVYTHTWLRVIIV